MTIKIAVTYNFRLNPYPSEFLKWTCPPSIFRTVCNLLWQYQDVNFKVGQVTVQSLVRLRACWPGSAGGRHN